MLQVGTIFVDLYHSSSTRAKSMRRIRSNKTMTTLESKRTLIETRVMMRDIITITGGIIWVREGLLVNPF